MPPSSRRDVEYEPLPLDLLDAPVPCAPVVHEDLGDSHSWRNETAAAWIGTFAGEDLPHDLGHPPRRQLTAASSHASVSIKARASRRSAVPKPSVKEP
jgi:hypothetical protein